MSWFSLAISLSVVTAYARHSIATNPPFYIVDQDSWLIICVISATKIFAPFCPFLRYFPYRKKCSKMTEILLRYWQISQKKDKKPKIFVALMNDIATLRVAIYWQYTWILILIDICVHISPEISLILRKLHIGIKSWVVLNTICEFIIAMGFFWKLWFLCT